MRQRGSSSCWSFLVLFPGLPPRGVRGVRGHVDTVFFSRGDQRWPGRRAGGRSQPVQAVAWPLVQACRGHTRGSHADEADPPHPTLPRGHGGARPRGPSANLPRTSGAHHRDGAREKRCEREALLASAPRSHGVEGAVAWQICAVGWWGRRSGWETISPVRCPEQLGAFPRASCAAASPAAAEQGVRAGRRNASGVLGRAAGLPQASASSSARHGLGAWRGLRRLGGLNETASPGLCAPCRLHGEHPQTTPGGHWDAVDLNRVRVLRLVVTAAPCTGTMSPVSHLGFPGGVSQVLLLL